MIQRTLLRAVRQTQPALRHSSTFSTCASRTSRPTSVLLQRRTLQQRLYSEEAVKPETAETNPDKGASAEGAAEKPSVEDPVRKELEAKNKEVLELTVRPPSLPPPLPPDSAMISHSLSTPQDRIKRSVAEYRNLQDQTKREIQAAKDFALQRFAKDLLDTIDNLDRALGVVPAEKLSAPPSDATQDLINLHSGLKMTEDILMGTLQKHGLQRFDPSETEGTRFDPNRMEATFQAPQQGKEDGSVFYTQSKGFTLNGRVLRAAKVGVVKNS